MIRSLDAEALLAAGLLATTAVAPTAFQSLASGPSTGFDYIGSLILNLRNAARLLPYASSQALLGG